jgi:hypothetical protein
MTPKYPNITVNLENVDGNAFSIMGHVTRAMRKHGVSTQEIDTYRTESMSGDYNNLLQTIGNWVNVEWGYPDDEDDYDDYDDDDDDDYYENDED